MVTTKQKKSIGLLLVGIITITGFYLVEPAPAWLPNWLGAAIALALLFGIFLTVRSAGALRGRFIALFAAALIAASLMAWLIR
jgi:uncharacterized membrane protein SirB2